MHETSLLILENHFRQSCQAVGLKVPSGVFEALAQRYSEPSRAYHTLQHVGECIAQAANVRSAPAAFGLAIWFHDAIYDPKKKDNEKRSAAWAGAVMGDHPARAEVERMILATGHDGAASDEAARLLVDIDLAILAAPEPRYSEYEAQVRREYAFVDAATWRSERLKVLRGFSDRAYIFGTAPFRALETRARKNLERSINALILAPR